MENIAQDSGYNKTKAQSKRLDLKILIWFIFATIFSIIIRYTLFPFESSEIINSLNEIVLKVKTTGEIDLNNLRQMDVNVAYVYLITFFSFLSPKTLIVVKIINTIFDLLLALGVWAIVKNYTQKKVQAIVAYTFALFSPSLLFISGFWGQSETIVITLLVWMVYSILKGRVLLVTLFFTLAFSIKWIAIFLFPLLVIWTLNQKKEKWIALLNIPLIYILFLVPMFLQGNNISNLLNLYIDQANQITTVPNYLPSLGNIISSNSTQNNVYFVGGESITIREILYNFSNYIFVLVFSIITWLGWVCKPDWNWLQTIRFSLFSSLIFPFFMSKGQSRYYAIALVFGLIYAFISPKKYWYVILIEIIAFSLISASALNIMPYLDKSMVTIALIALITIIGWELVSNFESFRTLQEKVALLSSKYKPQKVNNSQN
jgi:Gpi18-like mannosyltransferase